jgi:hypothetical protein
VSASLYTRQIRLAEVGLSGQARLGAAEISLACAGQAGDVEKLYLERAGATQVRPKPAGVKEHELPFEIGDPCARELARGAHAALSALRRVWLEGGSR